MTNTWLKYILIFILVVLIQGLVVNNIEINEFLNPMIYPMLILMLPFELGVLATLIISFILGITIDGFSNTFGLHASSSMLIGYLRPSILNYIKPRDGYDNSLLPSLHDMGIGWFIGYSSLFLFIHHLWFFSFEVLRFDLIMLIAAKTLFSVIFSLLLIILLQYILYTSSKK
ncbi:MAG: rod shape-determining protein MreD [Bacteroidetes bacterium]|nr:rod shape-determining protein MreD [Bacteroidota bacterium]